MIEPRVSLNRATDLKSRHQIGVDTIRRYPTDIIIPFPLSTLFVPPSSWNETNASQPRKPALLTAAAGCFSGRQNDSTSATHVNGHVEVVRLELICHLSKGLQRVLLLGLLEAERLLRLLHLCGHALRAPPVACPGGDNSVMSSKYHSITSITAACPLRPRTAGTASRLPGAVITVSSKYHSITSITAACPLRPRTAGTASRLPRDGDNSVIKVSQYHKYHSCLSSAATHCGHRQSPAPGR